MTTLFQLFMYFLLSGLPPGGFTGNQFIAIDRAFSRAVTTQREIGSGSGSFAVEPPAPVSVKPLANIPDQQFRPTVSEAVPVYKRPVKSAKDYITR